MPILAKKLFLIRAFDSFVIRFEELGFKTRRNINKFCVM
jgi:hypothetical protein